MCQQYEQDKTLQIKIRGYREGKIHFLGQGLLLAIFDVSMEGNKGTLPRT